MGMPLARFLPTGPAHAVTKTPASRAAAFRRIGRAWYKAQHDPGPGSTGRMRVKFKMAPNSLFAVLLRSPWWISIGLVALIALIAAALLPAQYVAFGVMGGFPFLVIGLIAAQRQWRAPGAAQTTKVLEKLGGMAWREFSQVLARAYERQGYQVSKIAGDAADLLLTKDGRTTLIACKRWKASIHGAEPLRALARARQQHDASLAIYVSIHAVNDATRRAARDHQIGLTDGVDLVSLVRKEAAFV